MRADDGALIYSTHLYYIVQDLLDTREAGWQKKVFKSPAKTKEAIRRDALRATAEQRGDGYEVIVAGQRPERLALGRTKTSGGSRGSREDGQDSPKAVSTPSLRTAASTPSSSPGPPRRAG